MSSTVRASLSDRCGGEYKSVVTKLTVSSGGREVTLTFPRGVGSAFQQIQDTEFVGMTNWRGDIVAVTAQGDTEVTSAAPSEVYRSRLTAAFYAASFTVVLAGVTLLSAVLSEWIFASPRSRPGCLIAAVVIFGGFATAVSATVIAQGGSLRAALLTAPIIVVAGIAVAGGVGLWSRLRHRRETDRIVRQMTGMVKGSR